MRWHAVLRLLPRFGFVVITVDVDTTVSFDPTAAAAVAVDGLRWLRTQWEHCDIAKEPSRVVDPDRPLAECRRVGHSYGAGVAARLAADQQVRCVARISGTWDDTEGRSPDLCRARVPTLLVAGIEDTVIDAHPSDQPFCARAPPVH